MELCCWWCTYELPQYPCIHLPIKYDAKLDRFTCIGNFCSWQCAKAYANDMNTCRSGEIQSFLAILRKRTFGKYVPLWPAPKRWALKKFGGTLSIEKFRSYGGLVEPPIVHFPHEKLDVQMQIIGGSGSTKNNFGSKDFGASSNSSKHMKAIETANAQTSTLKLRRQKPLQREESKLESMLGIKKKK